MAVYGQITITFTSDFQVGDRLVLHQSFSGVFQPVTKWTWATLRSSGFQVTVGTPTANVGERTAINFKTAFDLDFTTGYVTTVQNLNEVLIQSETQGEDFLDVFSIPSGLIGIPVIVNYIAPGEMAYKIKFYITYCDDFHTNRNVYILKKNHTGGASELLADVNPISITYESSEDFKFTPIRPSVAEVFMVFGSGDGIDFEEFWTADEREYQVQDIKYGDIEWIGFVIPNGFQYEFRGGLYHASIQASDGLSLMEALIFVDDNQKPYGNQDLVYNDEFEFPFSLIFTEILRKTGLDLDLWTAVDSYESTMLKVGDVREADPLSASYVNVKTYIKEGENKEIPYWYGSGEEWNCKEVLENILYIFGAKLYQEWGIWRVKSINADIDYGSGATQRYWRKYNTVGTYLGNYEVIDDEIEIPCNNTTKFLLDNDHVMSMDDVYSAFRMNYEYTFVRDGDTPVSLLTDLCNFNNTSILAAPVGWERWRWDNKWYIRIKDISIPFADAGGFTCGIEVGTHKAGIPTQQGQIKTDPNPAIWTSLQSRNFPFVEKGTKLILDVWNKYKFQTTLSFPQIGAVRYYPVYKMFLHGTTKQYNLVNSTVDNKRVYTWQETTFVSDIPFIDYEQLLGSTFFYLDFGTALNQTTLDLEVYKWFHFVHELAVTPEDGVIEFNIHGLAATTGNTSENFPRFTVFRDWTTRESWLRPIQKDWVDEGGDIPRLQIAGLDLGLIPNEDELPQQQDYIYENVNQNYTLEVDPIKIYNGDTQDVKHISNIIVPTNTGDAKNFWDDLSNTYGSSSLGLLTVREIMRQYQKPYRVFEGDVKIQDARFGSVYTFETIPNVRFVLLRGTFNKQRQYIEDATFVQLTSDLLPDGGSEGGNTLDPDWQPTGNFYCQTSAGLNTGYVITEERDINLNSETYNDTREVVSVAQDLDSCPLGEPRKYYWGSDDVYLNVFTLVWSPFFVVSSKEIQISMFNTEGNYLYFVHLKSLGVVDRIYTPTSPNNVLSDWVYLADAIIDGYLYRVLRTDYVMTEFTGFVHNFKFA